MTTSEGGNNKVLIYGAAAVVGLGLLYLVSRGAVAVVEDVEDEVDETLSNIIPIFRGYDIKMPSLIDFLANDPIGFSIIFAIQNKNNFTVRNLTFKANVFYEGINIGEVSTLQPFDMEALETTPDIRVDMKLLPYDLTEDLFEIFKQGTFSTTITLNGSISNGIITIPTGDIQGKLFTLPNGQYAIYSI